MNEPQFIRTAGGEELVVLSRADYDALIATAARVEEFDEDADDVAVYDAAKAAFEASGRLVTPPEVARFILDGDGALKAFRKYRGMTQAQLAEAAGIAQGFLSDIESKRRVGAPDTLVALAKALDIDPVWLLPASPLV